MKGEKEEGEEATASAQLHGGQSFFSMESMLSMDWVANGVGTGMA